ncbi:hypothetical protein AB0M02_24315 [Actinoplanes sp. NPDC051861]|uniref:hypothetical protein n=1 Tax=Actinoplanes sp. NPDC051861 TaxID=3155170 RepID=UPI003432A21B
MQFPFPECPACSTSWAVSRHRGCRHRGSMEVEPDARRVRCDGCSEQWAVGDTNFYCSCGRRFSTSDVDHAIEQILFSARLLAALIERHNDELARIRRQGRESFRSWLNSLAERLGGKAGAVMGHVVGAVVRLLF